MVKRSISIWLIDLTLTSMMKVRVAFYFSQMHYFFSNKERYFTRNYVEFSFVKLLTKIAILSSVRAVLITF